MNPETGLLNHKDIEEALQSLPGWKLVNNALQRELTFRDFSEAFAFMTRAALLSESLGHHPDWTNVYNRVSIRLFTHDRGGISTKDIEWARLCEKLLGPSSR